MKILSCKVKYFSIVSVCIMLNNTAWVMSSSELIFAQMKPISESFVRLSHKYKEVETEPLSYCLVHCFNDKQCRGVSYNTRLKHCEMIEKIEQNASENSEYTSLETDGWKSYYFAKGRCPADWFQYKSSCYFVQTNEAMRLTWQRATDACMLNTSHLVKIETAAENRFILTKLVELNIRENEHFWTAGNDQETEEVWVWGLESPDLFIEYSDWAQYEPNNQGNEDCIGIKLTPTRKETWNDLPCDFTYRYICEFSQ